MTTARSRANIEEKIQLSKLISKVGVEKIASAMSLRLGTDVRVGNLSASVLRASTLAEETTDPDNAAVGVCAKVGGDCPGYAVFLLPHHHALTLVDAVMGSPIGTRKRFNELSASALQEIARLVVSADLSALTEVSGIETRNEGITMTVDMAYNIVSSVVASSGTGSEEALVTAVEFEQADWKLEAAFIFIPTAGSLDKMLSRFIGTSAQLQ